MYRFQHLSGGLHPGIFRKWSSAYFGKKPFSCPAIDCLKRETASSPTGNRVAFVAIGKPERHVRKASHCGSKQQQSSPDEITLALLSRATYIVLFFAHIPFVVNRAFSATPAEWLQHFITLWSLGPILCVKPIYISANGLILRVRLIRTKPRVVAGNIATWIAATKLKKIQVQFHRIGFFETCTPPKVLD